MNHLRRTLCLAALSLPVLLAAPSLRAEDKPAEAPAVKQKTSLDVARATIAAQCELIKAANVDKLREGFTERQRERITRETVEKAQKELSQYKLEDLVDSVEDGEYEGKKTIKIKMKNGRSLTTLIETDGKWLADTIWFR